MFLYGGAGVSHNSVIVTQNKKYSVKSGEAARGVTIFLDDYHNSLILKDTERVIVNFTFHPNMAMVDDFKYFTLSGDAEWEILTNDLIYDPKSV